jgi:hypothetical protein
VTNDRIERLNECDVKALISWLRKLPQYKKWTALSPLAMELEKAFYDQRAHADTGLDSPCLGSSEAVRPSSPNTPNGIPKPCGASEYDSAVSEVGDTTGLNDDGPSTYVANTEESSNVVGPRKRRKFNGDRLSHGADRGSTSDSMSSVTVGDNQAEEDSSAESNISTGVLSPTSLDETGSSSPHSDSFRMEENLLGRLTDGIYEQEAMTEWESAYWHPNLGLQYC